MGQEVRFYMDIEGEVTYVSSTEPIKRRDGEYVVGENGELLEKRYMIVKGLDGIEYRIEAIGSKVSRRYWLDAMVSMKWGTQIKARLKVKSYSWETEDGRREVKNIFNPTMFYEDDTKYSFKVLWVPDDEPDLNPENSELPF